MPIVKLIGPKGDYSSLSGWAGSIDYDSSPMKWTAVLDTESPEARRAVADYLVRCSNGAPGCAPCCRAWSVETREGVSLAEAQDSRLHIWEGNAQRALEPHWVRVLFISHSTADLPFVRQLDEHLREAPLRTWLYERDGTAGPVEGQIREAQESGISVIVLSAQAFDSDWVEAEVVLARRIERSQHRRVLCPVSLDEAWKSGTWGMELMEQLKKYNILDFSGWGEPELFRRGLTMLVDGLPWYRS